MLDVAIVGAGVAGIAAAESCVSNGLTYVVLEAASESGGRCASRYLTDGTILDLGAHWLHSPPDNPLMQLATEHGVVFATRPLQEIRFNGSRMLSEQQVVDMDLCLESAFDAMSRDLHLSADGYSNLAGSWQDAFRTVFEIKQGRPPAMVSGLDFSRYRWIEDDLPVRGGMQTLLAALSRGKDIRTNHKVSSIDCTSADHVQLSGEFGTLSARRAVVTCSTGVIASKQIKFTPRLPDEMELAIETLPMGSCNKIFLGFKTSRLRTY